MKKILVPTDFSDCAQKALLFAANIAQKAEAEIILMHAGSLSEEKTENNHRQNVAQQLDALKQQTVLTHPIQITSKVMTGNLEASLQTLVTDAAIDLVVMGTQGASGFKKKLM